MFWTKLKHYDTLFAMNENKNRDEVDDLGERGESLMNLVQKNLLPEPHLWVTAVTLQ